MGPFLDTPAPEPKCKLSNSPQRRSVSPQEHCWLLTHLPRTLPPSGSPPSAVVALSTALDPHESETSKHQSGAAANARRLMALRNQARGRCTE